MTENSLKNRLGGHYTSFNHKCYRTSTKLSQHIWDLQKSNKTYQIYWEILETVGQYKPGNQYCNLCCSEKKWILKKEGKDRLNKNSEFVSKCPHKRKFKLGRIKGADNIDLLQHTAIQPENQNEVILEYIPRRSTRVRKEITMYAGSEWSK